MVRIRQRTRTRRGSDLSCTRFIFPNGGTPGNLEDAPDLDKFKDRAHCHCPEKRGTMNPSGLMLIICVNHPSSCTAAKAGVFIINDLASDSLPLNRLPVNKAPAIILSSCWTVSFEGNGGKVEGHFFLFESILEMRQRFSFLLQLGGFSLQMGVFSFDCIPKKTDLLNGLFSSFWHFALPWRSQSYLRIPSVPRTIVRHLPLLR